MLVKGIIIYLVIMNIGVFLLYGFDKWKAKADRWRVPEKTLLLTALAGGSLGALLGMEVFHHKTKHWKFRILVPLCLIIHVGILVYCLWRFEIL